MEGSVGVDSTYEEIAREFGDFSDDDISEGWSYQTPPRLQRREIEFYQTSYESWINAIIAAKSWEESWRLFKDGRRILVEVQPDHEDEEGIGREVTESDRLIKPFDERNRYYPKAFVTFKTFTAATTARQVIHMQLAGHMSITEAPEPRDVQWQHLSRTRKGTMLRSCLLYTSPSPRDNR